MEIARDDMNLDEYIQLVKDEERDVKEEIVTCVRLMIDTDPITVKLLALTIYALLELL